FFSFPASLGFAKIFGKKLRQAVGVSLLVPFMDKKSQAYLVDDATCGVHTIDLGGSTWHVDRVFLGALTYALRPTPWLRLGLNVGVAVRDISAASLTNFVLRHDGNDDTISVTYNEMQMTAWSLYAQIGAIAEPLPGFRVGLSITTPYVGLTAKGRLDTIETLRDPTDPSLPGTGTSTISILDDANFHWKVPLAFGLGIAYEQRKHVAFALDVKLHLPVAPHAAITHPTLPASEDFNVERRIVVNVNAGAEVYVWRDRLALRAGFFTNFSSNPKPDDEALLDGEEQTNLFGGTLGGAFWTNKASVITFALQVMYGRGDRAQLHILPAAQTTTPLSFDYQVAKASDLSVMLSVGGAVELD
ncbi:MAG: hypothetical protein KAI47_03640, partial [Deltaproteobacteria bacterium]|nr:hypothetical protein [Deltaproteobacteria bacterium]